MFGLEAYAYEAAGEALEARKAGGEAEKQGWFQRAFVVEDFVHDAVGEGLDALGAEHGFSAALLDPLEVVVGEGVGAEGAGEDVGGGDRVLQGDVDADAADRGHGVGGVADAEQAGGGPVFEAIDLDGEEFDLVPGVDGLGSTPEKWGKLLDGGVEGGEALLLDGGEGTFGDDEGGLEVVVAVDEDEGMAEVDVAEGVFGVVRLTREAHPEDIDGDALLDDVEVCSVAGDGVAAVAADGERGRDFDRAFGRIGQDACDPVGLAAVAEQAGGLPTHAEGEGGESGGFAGEEVEEVPLGHEGDVFCDGGEMGVVGDGELAAADDDGHLADL